jgi:hypothetical protein
MRLGVPPSPVGGDAAAIGAGGGTGRSITARTRCSTERVVKDPVWTGPDENAEREVGDNMQAVSIINVKVA